MSPPSRLHLICGGRYHDFDLARRVLLDLMAEDDRIRATCASDFSGLDALDSSDGLVLYTCDLMPDADQARAVVDFVERGGHVFALHATNAPIVFRGPAVESGDVRIPGKVEPCPPETAPDYVNLLGSRFQAHLAMQPFAVDVADPDHPLTRGLETFTVTDEPYVTEMLGEARVLLTARYKGDAPGYVLDHWADDAPRPQMYLRAQGEGEVLYLTLGHSCGRFDLVPMMPEAEVRRGPWDEPVYLELLRRGIAWSAGTEDG